MRIAILDDDKLMLKRLSIKIPEFIDKNNMYNFNFEYFYYNNPDELIAEHRKDCFDAAFLDIEIEGSISGLSTGDELYNLNNDIVIFYVTSFSSYIKESIEHRVFRFIEKFNDHALESGIKHMLKDFAFNESRYNFVYNDNNLTLKMIKINYFESSHNKVRIITDSKIYEQRTTISKLDKILPVMFCRCHRSYIVNTKKIENLGQNEILLDNGITIPLGRKYYHNLLSHIAMGRL